MESRFAHLRQRDTSVSMLRVKMSRRRSQSQKENRDRAVNTRRQLEKLAELEISSLDATVANMSTIHEMTVNKTKAAKQEALEERMKQLQRWKERKTLEKEKEKREKERKGVFKTGLYHPKDTLVIASLPEVVKTKETKVTSQPTRVTRSMKQQQQQAQKPLRTQDPNTTFRKVAEPAVERSSRSQTVTTKPAPAPAKTRTRVCAVEPVVRAPSSRSAKRPPVTAAPVAKDKPGDKPAEGRVTRGRAAKAVAPPPEPAAVQPVDPEEPVEQPCPSSPTPSSMEVDKVENQGPADTLPESHPTKTASSFAPKDFVFQAPTGLSTFQFEPLTPRSADAFLTPSFSLPPVPLFNIEPEAAPKEPSPSKSPCSSPPPPPPPSSSPPPPLPPSSSPPRQTSPTAAPLAPGSPMETKHDVPYFRLEITNETERLTNLCALWESKVEDESIPEEMRDRMRTAVGQARLLMKERFKQFSGLVDDCELGRGEKITTCSDLQGFWDMVYFQVEDVDRKFAALKETESRSWVEEYKPPPRQKKVVKKPAAASTKPAGAKAAAAKSRLAAVKAAMKAKQQAAMAETQAEAEAQPAEHAVLDGGLGQVESPAKPTGSLRRSSRLSCAVQPQASPCSSLLSPRRVTRRSLALARTPLASSASPAPAVHTPPVHLHLSLSETPAPTSQARLPPRSASGGKDNMELSFSCSPLSEVPPDDAQPPQAETGPLPLPSPASPCTTPPPPLCQAPEPRSCLSFTLSPCVISSEPPPAEQRPAEVPESPCHTPDSSLTEETPGLDFERYFQPAQRCSLSPQVSVAVETLSPMVLDVEMESPRGHCDDLLSQPAADSPLSIATSPPAASPMPAPRSQEVRETEAALLLFTPDPKDRIRQSVCPSDLMVFTPPL